MDRRNLLRTLTSGTLAGAGLLSTRSPFAEVLAQEKPAELRGVVHAQTPVLGEQQGLQVVGGGGWAAGLAEGAAPSGFMPVFATGVTSSAVCSSRGHRWLFSSYPI